MPSQPRGPVYQVERLSKYYRRSQGVWQKPALLQAVDNVTLYVRHAETFAVVGESGCGKTTLGKCMLRLIEPTYGRLRFKGQSLTNLSQQQLRPLRKHIQYVFQDPLASLNPRMRCADIVAEGIRIHITRNKSEVDSRVAATMKSVGLDPNLAKRFAHELSTGQRQRIGIARALAVEPVFVVCDEPVSALDMTVRRQVTALLQQLQTERSLSYLLISHELNVVRAMSHRVAVMYAGRLVESGFTHDVFDNPLHPYTRALLSAQPVADPTKKSLRIMLDGKPPDPMRMPPGCAFHPRCPLFDNAQCRELTPILDEIEPGSHHRVACWYAE